MENQPFSFVIYGREACHLCDVMRTELETYLRGKSIPYTLVEHFLDGMNHELEQQFGAKVPVLLCNNIEVCHYFFDQEKLQAILLS